MTNTIDIDGDNYDQLVWKSQVQKGKGTRKFKQQLSFRY